MEIVIGIIVALVGALFYQTTQKNKAEAGNQNIETKEKDLQLLREQDIINTSIQSSEEKLKEIDKKEQDAKTNNENSSIADDLKHWNKPKS